MNKSKYFRLSDSLIADSQPTTDLLMKIASERSRSHSEIMEAFIKPLVAAGATPDEFELVHEDRWEGMQLQSIYYLRRRNKT